MMDRVAVGPLSRLVRKVVAGEAGEGEKEVEVLVVVVANAILGLLNNVHNTKIRSTLSIPSRKNEFVESLLRHSRLLPYTCAIMAATSSTNDLAQGLLVLWWEINPLRRVKACVGAPASPRFQIESPA